MRPALEGRVDDVDGFLAEAFAAERPALTGDGALARRAPGLLERWGIADGVRRRWCAVWLTHRGGPRDPRDRPSPACTGDPVLPGHQPGRAPGPLHAGRRSATATCSTRPSTPTSCGVAKPDPAYFTDDPGPARRAPRTEVLFVDDNLRNVEAARDGRPARRALGHGDGLDALRDHLARHGLPVP